MDRIRRVAIATNIPYSAVKLGATVAPPVRTLWMSALITDSEDSLNILSAYLGRHKSGQSRNYPG